MLKFDVHVPEDVYKPLEELRKKFPKGDFTIITVKY